jgi:hypothetical protein
MSYVDSLRLKIKSASTFLISVSVDGLWTEITPCPADFVEGIGLVISVTVKHKRGPIRLEAIEELF